MERDTRNMLIVVIVVIAAVFAAFGGLVSSSGVSPPFTTVDSQSMQHGVGSQIGIIDTGDLMVVKSPDKVSILSYVEGYQSGHSSFGNYGDVIIYERGGGKNPVIHRAILYLEYNGNSTWAAPSLAGYPSELWYSTGGGDYNNLSGVLTMRDLRYTHALDVNLNLDDLAENTPWSGYITMGDNNTLFDQSIGISDGPVKIDGIKSVAWIEVPWLGSVKMLLAGKGSVLDQQVPNTIPSMAAVCVAIIFMFIGFNFLLDHRIYSAEGRALKKKETPTPPFPLEHENE